VVLASLDPPTAGQPWGEQNALENPARLS